MDYTSRKKCSVCGKPNYRELGETCSPECGKVACDAEIAASKATNARLLKAGLITPCEHQKVPSECPECFAAAPIAFFVDSHAIDRQAL